MSDFKLKYRALEPEDVTMLFKWENDLEINEVSLSKVPFSKYILEQYIAQAHLDIQQAGQYRFVLEDTEGNAVGCVDLFDYDAIDRRAAIGIIIEKKYRLKGYAAEAITLMKDYAFNRIGMRQLHCSVGVSNEKSIQLFRSAGFTEIGIRKDWSFRNGAFHDVVEFQFINK
ncbi:MAG: GNAT family protein [Flavobacteriales bacterium]|jgi:diamine N-acetyltransferase|tara:strand:+ start:905 stop:1417 length:513 start_codon:yes stop_codon:yes gene_type:complete